MPCSKSMYIIIEPLNIIIYSVPGLIKSLDLMRQKALWINFIDIGLFIQDIFSEKDFCVGTLQEDYPILTIREDYSTSY